MRCKVSFSWIKIQQPQIIGFERVEPLPKRDLTGA